MSKKTSEESVPVQEVKEAATLSVRRFLRSIAVVVLSFVCICIGVIIYRIHTPLDREGLLPVRQEVRQPLELIRTDLTQRPLKIAPAGKTMFDKEAVVASQPKSLVLTTPIETIETEPVLPRTEMGGHSVFENVKPIATEIEAPPEPAVPEPEVAPEPAVPTFTIGDALHLRDQLGMGDTCLDSFGKLLKSQLPDERQRAFLTERLMPICTATPAFQELKNLFLANKKDALMTYYQMTSGVAWLAYVKMVATSIVDIRRLNPTKQRPKDLISLAQTALNRYDVAGSLGKVRQLPPQMLADFREFIGQAQAYVLAQEAVDHLILSYDKKGK